MEAHLDVEFDFFTLKAARLRALLDTLGLPHYSNDSNTDLVIRLEKHASDHREAQGTNCKQYLSPDFSPEQYFMPKLRSILSQYGVHYGTRPKRALLVEIFMDHLPFLKSMNGLGQPDMETEMLTDNFNSMKVENTFHPAAPAKQHNTRRKNATFVAPTRVQPQRQTKQAYASNYFPNGSAAYGPPPTAGPPDSRRPPRNPNMQRQQTPAAPNGFAQGGHQGDQRRQTPGAPNYDAAGNPNMQRQQTPAAAAGQGYTPSSSKKNQPSPVSARSTRYTQTQEYAPVGTYDNFMPSQAAAKRKSANAPPAPTVGDASEDGEETIYAVAANLMRIALQGDMNGLVRILNEWSDSRGEEAVYTIAARLMGISRQGDMNGLVCILTEYRDTWED